MGYSKIIDATSGSFLKTTDNEENVQFVISGTPNANIRIFMIERNYQRKPFARIKVTCEDWNGASVIIKYKTNHPDDTDFVDTGDTITENGVYNLTF